MRDGASEYEIISVLGEGSFGITYLAWYRDNSAPGSQPRQVAVKEFFMHDINGRQNGVVTSSVTDGMYDKYMRKFKNEASALNRLRHDNIVRVHNCFEANNTVYYAMEYLNGGSVDDDLANRGPLPQRQALKLAAQVASALSYLHSSNMLHLDLKPSNIMLRDPDHVALIDFGLAKQFDDNGNPESSTTIGGGTPGYAPIEQQNSVELANFYGGKSSLLPVTMDIYAFGATLYKMLVGKMPPMPDEILDNDVLPPQCLYERQVSPELIQVLTKAMKPRKKDRYQSIAEMYAAFEPLLQPGEEAKIWTPADLKAQAPQQEPFQPQQASSSYEQDGGTVIAGQKPQKNSEPKPQRSAASAKPWELQPAPANNPFATSSTVMVDSKKKKNEAKPSKHSEPKSGDGGSKRGMIIGIIAALVLIGGGLGIFFATQGDKKETAAEGMAVVEPSAVEEETIVAEEVQQPEEAAAVEEALEEAAEQPIADDKPVDDVHINNAQEEQTSAPLSVTPKPKTKSVLGGKAEYDPGMRTIIFNSDYNLRAGDQIISVPAGARLEKVTLHSNGNLRSCVLSGPDGKKERLDGLNIKL